MNEELDRLGLCAIGIFIGGIIEAIGIPRLSIVISTALIVIIFFIDKFILKNKTTENST